MRSNITSEANLGVDMKEDLHTSRRTEREKLYEHNGSLLVYELMK